MGEEKAMITLAQCAAFSGLASHEVIGGAVPSARHHKMLSSYLLNLDRGTLAVREMIVSDLRRFLDLGAEGRAADLMLVLRLLLSDYPEARCTPPEQRPAGLVPSLLIIHHLRSKNKRSLPQSE